MITDNRPLRRVIFEPLDIIGPIRLPPEYRTAEKMNAARRDVLYALDQRSRVMEWAKSYKLSGAGLVHSTGVNELDVIDPDSYENLSSPEKTMLRELQLDMQQRREKFLRGDAPQFPDSYQEIVLNAVKTAYNSVSYSDVITINDVSWQIRPGLNLVPKPFLDVYLQSQRDRFPDSDVKIQSKRQQANRERWGSRIPASMGAIAPMIEENVRRSTTPLRGSFFVLTGKMSETRDRIEGLIQSNGGITGGAFTLYLYRSMQQILVLGATKGTTLKQKDANTVRALIISEQQLRNWIETGKQP